jgi:uncharacterized membrane protein YedE/YeeE
MTSFVALISGIIFGLGLAVSGMTDTAKVQGFLDLFGNWVPDLMFVMGGALIVSAIAYQIAKKKIRPMLRNSFDLPQNKTIDQKLITGSVIFGVGWGLYGLCPGPALTHVLSQDGLLFVAAMLVGMLVSYQIKKFI